MDMVTLAIALSKIQQVKKELRKEDFKIQVEQDRSILNRAGQEKMLYFLPAKDTESSNAYDEYIYVNNTWEQVGSTKIDLSNYYQKDEINELLNSKEDIITEEELTEIVTGLYPQATTEEVRDMVDSLLENYSTTTEAMIDFIIQHQDDQPGAEYAPLQSPHFTGIPTAPTANTDENSAQIATTAFVKNTIDNLGLSGAMHFRGIDTSGNVYSGSTIGKYTVSNGSITNAILGDVLLDDNEEFVWTGNNWELLGPNVSFKIQQSAVFDPTASGTSTSFISSISQDTNGNITASKANLPAYPTKVSDLTNDSGFLTSHQDISGKANLNSPAFTGTPTAPTASFGNNTTQIATTAFVQQAIRPTIMVTVNDMPFSASVAVTATLIGSDPEYSVTEILNSSGVASLGMDYLGEYSITFNNPQVKGNPTINVTIPKVYTYGAYWSEMITYTVLIDKNNSNTATACTYADDALGMTKGSSLWNNMPIFKQIRPCVFQNGQVNYYLNPDNWNEKYGTNELSVLTGEDGDVMIEFPKFAYKIKTVDNTITVSVSTDPTVIENDNDYTYDAFSRLEEGDLNFFYKGAFKGYVDGDGKLRSIVGTKPANNRNIGAFRTAAQANGSHYQQSTYAQLKALQCLYLIKYGDRNGQSAVGRGVVSASASYVSGYNTTDVANISSENSTLTSGMTFGTTANSTTHMRLFGIEDFWGCIQEWIDGLTTDSSRNIVTSWNSFSNEGITATTVSTASGLTANSNGYIKDVAGNTDAGFMPINFSDGSSSTFWAGSGYLSASCVLNFGGAWDYGDSAGPFYLYADSGASYAYATIGARLSYV